MDDLRAISLRQPWAWALFYAGKDIENRPRRGSHRGLTLIHASAGMKVDEWAGAAEFMRSFGLTVPSAGVLERGGIVGAIEFGDCVEAHESRWFVGPFGFIVSNPKPIPFIPCRGTIFPLFWTPPPDVVARARAALGISD